MVEIKTVKKTKVTRKRNKKYFKSLPFFILSQLKIYISIYKNKNL